MAEREREGGRDGEREGRERREEKVREGGRDGEREGGREGREGERRAHAGQREGGAALKLTEDASVPASHLLGLLHHCLQRVREVCKDGILQAHGESEDPVEEARHVHGFLVNGQTPSGVAGH